MTERIENREIIRVHADPWQAWTRIRKKNLEEASRMSVQGTNSEKRAKMAAMMHLKGLPYQF